MLKPATKMAHFLPLYLVSLLIYSTSPASATTTIHFFGHTSCNAGTALGAPFTGNTTAEAGICETAPANAVALYVDGLDTGCTVTAYANSLCAKSESLPLGPGKCFFLVSGATIGSFEATCGGPPNASVTTNTAGSVTNGTMATSMFSGVDSATATAMTRSILATSNGTSSSSMAMKTTSTSPGLQASSSNPAMSAGNGGMVAVAIRAVLTMVFAEVIRRMS